MAKDPFLLVSLEENESKALAQVMSNDTARKILDLLSKEESATATDIARKLKVPLSTVHYNLQALVKANLVKSEEFHYSEKGKEVNHYSLANKLIIIAPKKSSAESFKDKLKSILPVALITLAAGGLLQLFTKLMARSGGARLMAATPAASPLAVDYSVRSVGVAEKAIAPLAEEGAGLMMTAANESGRAVVENATENIEPAAQQIIQVVQQAPATNIVIWFLIGVGFTLVLLVIWYWFVTRKKK